MFKVLMFASLFVSSNVALGASAFDFECYRDGAVTEVCIVTPDDLKAEPAPRIKTPVFPVANQVMMVSRYELSGQALSLDNEFTLDDGVVIAGTPDRVEESISQNMRWIETFLKTGPSGQSDNIFVRPASKTK
jgi:hypothetical protein